MKKKVIAIIAILVGMLSLSSCSGKNVNKQNFVKKENQVIESQEKKEMSSKKEEKLVSEEESVEEDLKTEENKEEILEKKVEQNSEKKNEDKKVISGKSKKTSKKVEKPVKKTITKKIEKKSVENKSVEKNKPVKKKIVKKIEKPIKKTENRNFEKEIKKDLPKANVNLKKPSMSKVENKDIIQTKPVEKKIISKPKSKPVEKKEIIEVVKYTTANLNVRSEMNTSSKILKVLPKGTKVIINSISVNGWYKLINEEGYIKGDYLSSKQPTQKAVAPVKTTSTKSTTVVKTPVKTTTKKTPAKTTTKKLLSNAIYDSKGLQLRLTDIGMRYGQYNAARAQVKVDQNLKIYTGPKLSVSDGQSNKVYFHWYLNKPVRYWNPGKRITVVDAYGKARDYVMRDRIYRNQTEFYEWNKWSLSISKGVGYESVFIQTCMGPGSRYVIQEFVPVK